MRYIGITGLAGSGKSTVAAIIARKLGIPVLGFANPIKRGLATMGITKGSNPRAYRSYAQTIGNEMRLQDMDYWVKLFLANAYPAGVIDDVRYANEAAAITSRGGIVVLLKPKGWEPSPIGGMTEEQEAHESEEWVRSGEAQVSLLVATEVPNRQGEAEAAADHIIDLLKYLSPPT
jgi:hypothetical protein